MPCYNPSRVVMQGDHRINFQTDWKWAYLEDGHTVINLPCRHCHGCNRAMAIDWSVRCYHEALCHTEDYTDPITNVTAEIPNSSCVTLTYDDEHLPPQGLLQHRDFQLFMKRLHKSHPKKQKPRFFMAGEYGGKTGRPHYHSIIFGESFSDRYSDGSRHQQSYILDELWQNGRATVADFSFAAAGYVAGYIAKSQNSKGNALNWKHNGPIEELTSEDGTKRFLPIRPEYHTMSKNPGLGAAWIKNPNNLARVYSDDCVKISKWTFHPPKFYDNWLKDSRPEIWGDVVINRHNGMSLAATEWSKERCNSAEQIALSSLQLRRDSL